MTMNAQVSQSIIAVFTENGFSIDAETGEGYYSGKLLADLRTDPHRALLLFGFEDGPEGMSQSVMFLHGVASFFIEKLSKRADIEFIRSADPLTSGEAASLLMRVPYAIGAEFVDQRWLNGLWDGLSEAFASELAAFDGNAAQYLLAHKSDMNIAGRVFFHLVENKTDSHPFAFLATYSRKASGSGRTEHVPLRNALLEYKDDQPLLLQLLSTVSRAAERSEIISELVESGELFSPLRFTAQEAHVFLSRNSQILVKTT